MKYNYEYQKIYDAFSKAASPVVAEAAFDSIRESLRGKHQVTVTLPNEEKVSFTSIDNFNQWVKKTFYKEEK